MVNIIGTHDCDRKVELGKLARTAKEIFEPELFSGLKIKLRRDSASVFCNGKCSFFGVKSEHQLYAAFMEVGLLLDERLTGPYNLYLRGKVLDS